MTGAVGVSETVGLTNAVIRLHLDLYRRPGQREPEPILTHIAIVLLDAEVVSAADRESRNKLPPAAVITVEIGPLGAIRIVNPIEQARSPGIAGILGGQVHDVTHLSGERPVIHVTTDQAATARSRAQDTVGSHRFAVVAQKRPDGVAVVARGRDVQAPVVIEVRRRQTHRASAHDIHGRRLKGAIAMIRNHRDHTVVVAANDEVRPPITVHIAGQQLQAISDAGHIVDPRLERAVPVSEHHTDRIVTPV